MIVRVVETAKGPPKSQIANDIKRGVVIPGSYVHKYSSDNAMFVQSLDKEINVVFDKRLVITHNPVAEAMRALTS